MKRLFGRLFGNTDPHVNEEWHAAGHPRFEIEHYGHGLVRIPTLDYFGPHAVSPKGAYHLLWLDRTPDGSRGGYREEGHGRWSLLDSAGAIVASGDLERPQDGHVADNGNFILSDWLFGDGLTGRLTGFRRDGQKLFEREFSANLGTSALSQDGHMAICSTLNSPGSPDDCRHFLFNLDVGAEIASWPQETGWVEAYAFDMSKEQVALLLGDGERVVYGFDGEMIDRPAWQGRRIAAGDLGVIRSVLEAAAYKPDTRTRSEILAGLAVAGGSGEMFTRARALRLEGELRELSGEIDAAIAVYEQVLTIDPQVGVSRRLAKLQRERSPKSAKPVARRVGSASSTKSSSSNAAPRRNGGSGPIDR